MANKCPSKVTDTESLLTGALSLNYFQPNTDGVLPIPVRYVPGTSKLVVAVGTNASGKSFFRRIIREVCHKVKIECIHISMESRANICENPAMCFVYGSEEYQSTGENSTTTVLGAIRTSQAREKQHVIFWDEPDLGLSDDWSASMGAEIREFAIKAPELLLGAIVVTHNKALLRELLPVASHFLCFSDNPTTSLAAWLEQPVHIRPLAELKEDSYKRFRLIQEIINQRKK